MPSNQKETSIKKETSIEKKKSKLHKLTGDKIATIVLLSIFGVFMIIYIIVLYYMFDTQTGIFERYTSPKPPSNGFEILGEITPLTPTEFKRRNEFYKTGFPYKL